MRPFLFLAALTLAPAAMAQQAGTVVETYALPAPMQAAPVQAAPIQGDYIDIGAYPGGELEAPGAVPLAPAAPVYDLYQPVPESTSASVVPPSAEIAYAPIPDITALPQATWSGGSYESDRLAAFDTDGDGTVTTREAIATLKPLDD